MRSFSHSFTTDVLITGNESGCHPDALWIEGNYIYKCIQGSGMLCHTVIAHEIDGPHPQKIVPRRVETREAAFECSVSVRDYAVLVDLLPSHTAVITITIIQVIVYRWL